MDLQTNKDNMQLLIYNRLLFEIKILRQTLQNSINNELKHIDTNANMLKQIQETFYVISNNLYPL